MPPPPDSTPADIAAWRASTADAIFEGRLEALRLRHEFLDSAPGEWIAADLVDDIEMVGSFSVSRVYRGSWQGKVPIVTGLGGGDCGFEFEVGHDYLVYAYEDDEGRLVTSICSGTGLLENRANHLAYLRGEAVVPEILPSRETPDYGRLCGRVTGVSRRVMADSRIVLIRIGQKSQMVRDQVSPEEDGSFCAEALDPGKYHAAFVGGPEHLPAAFVFFPSARDIAEAEEIEIRAGETISGIQFDVPPQRGFVVRGKVRSTDRVPRSAEVHVALLSVEHPVFLLGYAIPVKRNGSFAIPRVLPGKYWAAVGVITEEDPDNRTPRWLTRKLELTVQANIMDLVLELTPN